MTASGELESEQKYLHHARAALAAMQTRAADMLEVGERSVRDENTVDSRVIREHLKARSDSLELAEQSLCFGRIDEESQAGRPGDIWYIGRRHIEDEDGVPVVVDWRAPVAIPFYRATAVDAQELDLRRRFTCEVDELLAVFDEDFTDPDSLQAAGIPDPLLAEIERDRSGQMADIVSTVAAEQDVIIRSPLSECVLVQGGPGTGKTAVGLHRAAFLLFENRSELSDSRVLVVGPNRVFLHYIGNVLPSLGETAVSQATVRSLLEGRNRVRAEDAQEVAELKGRLEMAAILRAAALQQIRPITEDLVVPAGSRSITFTVNTVTQAQKTALDRKLPLNECRTVYSQILAREAKRDLLDRGMDLDGADMAIRTATASKEFGRLLTKTWPTLSGPGLVRTLLSKKSARNRAGSAILQSWELDLLHRPAAKKLDDEQWTVADLALIDEAHIICGGKRKQYGHVVVDEAQDLTAMALRAVGRRARHGSMTVLGDIAQATAVGCQISWTEIQRCLGLEESPVVRSDLTVGYRVPAPILDVANRLLPVIASEVLPSSSVRQHGAGPHVVHVDQEDVVPSVRDAASSLAEEWKSVGVIAPPGFCEPVLELLRDTGLEVVDTRGSVALDAHVSVVEPLTAKGLEFDAVVVVEPDEIAQLPNGLRLLYVALTRSVQRLTIVHSAPLPEPIL